MTLLSQLGLWATGSDLNKNLQKLRIYITLITALFFGLLLIFNTFASIHFTNLALESRRGPRFGNSGPNLNPFEQDRREQENLRRKDFEEQQLLATGISNTWLLLLLTLGTYLLIYPLLKPIQEEINKREQFLSHASHELRTPLAVMHSNLSLVPSSPIITKSLEEIKRLQSVSDRILNGYTQEKTKTKNEVKSYNIIDIINEIIIDLKPINTKNIQFTINPIANFTTDKYFEVYQILYNAITNIELYSTPSSTTIINIDTQKVEIINDTPALQYQEGVGLEIIFQEAKRSNLTIETKLDNNQFTFTIQKIK